MVLPYYLRMASLIIEIKDLQILGFSLMGVPRLHGNQIKIHGSLKKRREKNGSP